MELVIVTGMSGAGKSTAMMALEDSGYFCVDNVPPTLLSKFVELSKSSVGQTEKMALCIDTRSFHDVAQFNLELDTLADSDASYQMVFLDAATPTLIRRYKENRRPHPMVKKGALGLAESVEQERAVLNSVKVRATNVINTDDLNIRQLKDTIVQLFFAFSEQTLTIQCMSFGFKYGIPTDHDIMFDVRCLPNPFYIQSLREKTGLTKEVSDYVLSFPESRELLRKLIDLLDFTYPLYIKEGKNRLVVAIGCTGGKHRSVTFVEEISRHLISKSIPIITLHRDKDRVVAK